MFAVCQKIIFAEKTKAQTSRRPATASKTYALYTKGGILPNYYSNATQIYKKKDNFSTLRPKGQSIITPLKRALKPQELRNILIFHKSFF